MAGPVTEGQLSHRLMQARELTEDRPDLESARRHIDTALALVRQVHHRRH
jgi:hypothetical protein